jgi:elongation of very long chain fatty acids protein 7
MNTSELYRPSSSILFSSTSLSYILRDYWDEEGDPRTRDFALMQNGPWTMLSIMCAYLIFVKKLGPELMKNREPFVLRTPMLIYNIFLVVFNAYFFVEALICIRFGLDLFIFDFPDRTDTGPKAMRMIYSGYAYFLTKFVDLLDTVFFVLRKKYSQVRYL